ncbi:MAG: autotransporter-associated beta strand repeat-containing protein, partial [Salinisphaera sp.]|nr:autotransporter-associated beta strand repeat-containing protein [Salinisphaera sp.]
MNLAIDHAALRALVDNGHLIQADGGTVILAAKAAGDLAATVVNNEGVIQAQSIANVNGVIRLAGGDEGIVRVSGTLDASGKNTGESGGSIQVLGAKAGLFAGAQLDAAGDAGGGTVLVGGDFQGNNAAIRNAAFTYVDPGAIVNADAITTGNGGRVIVWADDSTRFSGFNSAKGGSQGGDGGFVEVSGKKNLGFVGTVATGAARGKTGSLLLDPDDLYVGIDPGGGALLDSSNPFQAMDGINNYYVLESSFLTDNNYTLQASHDVIFNENVIFNTHAGTTVSITAANHIESAAFLVETNGAALTFNATTMALGQMKTNGGLLTINNSGTATQTGEFEGLGVPSSLTKEGAGTLTLFGVKTYNGITTINGGVLSVDSINNMGVAGGLGQPAVSAAPSLVLGGGTLRYTGATASTDRVFALTDGTTSSIDVTANNLTLAGASTATTGALTKLGAGTLTLSGNNLYTGLTTVGAGTLAYGVANALSSGPVTVDGGTLNIGAFSDTVGAVTLTSGVITGAAGVLTGASYAMQSGTVSAILGGTGALTKTTAGTVTLSRANTYTGLTTVSAGKLIAANPTALGSTAGATTVESGGTLQVANVALGNEPVTLSGTGVAADGALTGTGTASLAGPVTLAAASSIGAAAGNTLAVNGTIDGGFALDVGGGGSITLGSAVGSIAKLASFGGAAGTALAVNGGRVQTSGAQNYGGTTTFGDATTLRTTGGAITATGAVTATAGTLTLDTGTGDVTLANTSNNFATVQATSGGAISLVDSNAMILGSSSLGTLEARTLSGDLALGGNITASDSGNAIVLAAAGNFNNAGGFTLTPGTGRWLVYTSDPDFASFGGLSSGNVALWNRSYSGNPPASITQTGNRYLFETTAQSLTFTPTAGSMTKTYGDDVTGSLSTLYTYSGANTNTYGGAILADSSVALSSLFSGAPAITSAGAPATANVSGSPYAITAAAGTLSSLTGYGMAFGSSGTITVNPYAVSLSGARIYDGTANVAAAIFSFGPLVGSETLVLSGSGTVADKHVGSGKAVNTAGLTLGNGTGLASNYTFTGGTQTADISALALTGSVTAADKV